MREDVELKEELERIFDLCTKEGEKMKDYNVVAYLNVEAEFQVQAEDEDAAMAQINKRIEQEGADILRDSGFVVTTEYGSVECWELENEASS